MSIKIPYGRSTFKEIIHRGFLYIDRTSFIEKLESIGSNYIYFLRPRRFGKSLWLSTLHNYYGLEHKKDFTKTFQNLYIGQNPTPLANTYLVLTLDFSQIETQTDEETYKGFRANVIQGISLFFARYRELIPYEELDNIIQTESPISAFKKLLDTVALYAPNHQIYLLIDEYDHFANEILSLRTAQFKQIVSQNGWVRKFYETIKAGAAKSIIDRVFITGVSPITLDSMTSGFNIATSLTSRNSFHNLMGFTEEEVKQIMEKVGMPQEEIPEILNDLTKWYNGYQFHKKARNKLYNPNMVLYFCAYYNQEHEYPENLLDPNITTDTHKLRKLFQNKSQNYRLHLREVLNYKQKPLVSRLSEMFHIEQEFSRQDFISILFYMGMLTIAGKKLDANIFTPPNYVIEKLYHQYFFEKLLQEAQIPSGKFDFQDLFRQIALENNIPVLAQAMQELLALLVNRDAQQFDEKHIKITLLSILLHAETYTIHSEYTLGKRHADIVLIRKPLYPEIHQFIFELKYIKTSQAHKLPEVAQQAEEQLKSYLQHPNIKNIADLKAWVIIFAGFEKRFVKEIEVS